MIHNTTIVLKLSTHPSPTPSCSYSQYPGEKRPDGFPGRLPHRVKYTQKDAGYPGSSLLLASSRPHRLNKQGRPEKQPHPTGYGILRRTGTTAFPFSRTFFLTIALPPSYTKTHRQSALYVERRIRLSSVRYHDQTQNTNRQISILL